MQDQVITIGMDGTISGLQRKPGQGIDLREFGHAEITRASEIVWSEIEQLWTVVPLQGRYAGIAMSRDDWEAWVSWPPAGLTRTAHATNTLLFAEYDDAVKAEIAFLDALRIAGLLT